MNIQIITSSYPAFEGDPGGTAGLFVESFAKELALRGHNVIVQPVKRKDTYATKDNIIIEPIPWQGGDQVLAAMNLFHPKNWPIFLNFFKEGKKCVIDTHQKYHIDRTLCMWVLPCGLFGYWIHKQLGKKYDVWALGSDIWKIRKVPLIGNYWINKIVRKASGVFADGLQLCQDVKEITGRECDFLASTRSLPPADGPYPELLPKGAMHFLFVGRYHKNKGPDLLLEALTLLPEETKQNIRVHMFGLGDLEEELKEYCLNKNLTGFVNLNGPIAARELSNYLKKVSFLLIPSRIESIPVIFSDALSMGTPVVTTPVGDLRDFIKDYDCGILADEISPKSLADAITTATRKKKEDFSANVKAVYEKFNISQSVKQWLAGEGI